MAKINLGNDEAILAKDSDITHDRGSMWNSCGDELVLTNHALIVVHKNAFGRTKDVVRYPLSDLKVANGTPQVMPGKGTSGERQLHVYFKHGMEAFTLGTSDDDDDISLKSLFTSLRDKEKQNIQKWCDAITCAALGTPSLTEPIPRTSAPSSMQGFVQGAIGSIAHATGISENSHTTQAAFAAANNVTRKCIGCMAPITGVQGSKAQCKYCDTEQTL